MTEALSRRSIDTIRTLAMDAVEAAKSGHPGTPMALAPLAYALWTRVMAYDPADPAWPDRDRFVLSAGHASMLLYASLHLVGYDLSLDDLKAFRQWGSKTPGHPEVHEVPGVETTTGPLGQGISTAVGLALAERMLAARFNKPGHEVVDHHTYVIAGDGDLMEGVSSEACSLAGHWGLHKLTVFYDDNRITIDGTTDLAFTEDVGKRFEAYGWNVLRVPDTATVDDLVAAADAARREVARPTLVMVRTHIGFGSPNKQDSPKAHGEPLGKDEIRLTKRPTAGRRTRRSSSPTTCARTSATRAAGRPRRPPRGARASRRTARRSPPTPRAFEAALAGTRPRRPRRGPRGRGRRRQARRDAEGLGGRRSRRSPRRMPTLVGGSADLAGSNGTTIAGSPVRAAGRVRRAQPRVRGARARDGGGHATGSRSTAASGRSAARSSCSATSCAPRSGSRRCSALGVVYVFTHDSIGLGEDGPTHQPVEHLAALRAIPGVLVIRPADAVGDGGGVEGRARDRSAGGARADAPGPRAAAGGRARRRSRASPAAGTSSPGPSGAPAVVLVGSGSEVGVALGAARLLEARGVAARVVSMPSL